MGLEPTIAICVGLLRFPLKQKMAPVFGLPFKAHGLQGGGGAEVGASGSLWVCAMLDGMMVLLRRLS